MVKKLFKHEVASYLRILLPTYFILMFIALSYRVIQMFDSETIVYTIILTSSRIVYGLSVAAVIGFTAVLPIIRFYKNLFTTEGYLTFTLPVTPTEHLWVKLSCAVLVSVMTVAAAALSWLIVTAGEFFTEFVKAVAYLWGEISDVAAPHVAIGIFEFIIVALLGLCSGYLLYFLCIAIGQLFRKNRIIAAVGIYFGFNVVSQIITTVISVVMTVVGIPFFDRIGEFIVNHTAASIHIFFGVAILIEAIIVTAFFLIIRYIVTKKLNLE